MNAHTWVGLLCVSLLVACSEGNKEQVLNEAMELNQQSTSQVGQMDEPAKEETVDFDCPGVEELFAFLPDQLSGEAISEQYFSCNPVTPTATSHFTSEDQNTYWTFSVTSRELESPPARLRWDVANADESLKASIRKNLKASIENEVLLFDLCVNNLQQAELPDWAKTSRVTAQQHDICIGTDAQVVEDGRWLARAKSPQYLYTLEVEGEKAAQFDSAQEASSYIKTLFSYFR